MIIKKIILYLLVLVITGLISIYIWSAYIFFPDDYETTRREARETLETRGSEVIDVSLIDIIDDAVIEGDFSRKNIEEITGRLKDKNYLIKDDPFITNRRRNLCFRIGTGLPGIWVDERSSLILPDSSNTTFTINLNDSPYLEFSAISLLANGILNVEISGDNGKSLRNEFQIERYIHKYSIQDLGLPLNNTAFQKARDETGWNDYSIDLSTLAGRKARISFSFKGDKGALFLANPRVFKRREKRRHNVIYLIFDGVATRHWSFYNEKSNLTPFMKKAADRDFVVFDNMFSLGNKTRISTAGLFTSLLPFKTRHGINRNFIPERDKEIFYKLVQNGRMAALPDVYRKDGYITQQFGNSGFTVHLITTGIDYGFERSYEFSYNPYDSYGISHALFDFLRKNKEREFFLYLHYNTPHKPFFAPMKYYLKGVLKAPIECLWRPLFMGCINYTDDVFKNIYLALESNNLLDNTILVVATDHGAGYDVNKYDKGFQYNDYSRMSFMIRLPDSLKEKLGINRKRVDTYLSSLNTAPTLLDICGMDRMNVFKGRSYLNVLNGKFTNKFFDEQIWCFGRKTASLISANMYKYILTLPDAKRLVDREYLYLGNEKELPFEEIYNLKNDPYEEHNLINEKKSILKEFRKIFLNSDIHHPERTALAFMPYDGLDRSIEVAIKSGSRIFDAGLYSKSLELQDNLKVTKNKKEYKYSFNVKNKPLYFIFENEDDRSPLSIYIKSNGIPLENNSIFATDLNLNILSNPIILKERNDFLVLNDLRLPQKSSLIGKEKGLKVKISRIDLHRWIDIGRLESIGISAGMKETLKSWGYIQ